MLLEKGERPIVYDVKLNDWLLQAVGVDLKAVGLEFAGDGGQRHVDAAMIDHRGEYADAHGPKDPVLIVGAARESSFPV